MSEKNTHFALWLLFYTAFRKFGHRAVDWLRLPAEVGGANTSTKMKGEALNYSLPKWARKETSEAQTMLISRT